MTSAANRIRGLNHVTLAVGDLDESVGFYCDVLGLRPVARAPGTAYLVAGELWLALVEDQAARPGPLPEYTHLAFTVTAEDLAVLRERLRAAGAVEWQTNRTEGESLYFLDPTGHKLELHVGDLSSRLAALGVERPYG